MIADVAFNLPLDRGFSYRVPEGWHLSVGQRVKAPLQRGLRAGVVVALRDEDGAANLETIREVIDGEPLLKEPILRLTKKVGEETVSAWGEVLAAALPPPPRRGGGSFTSSSAEANEERRPEIPRLLTGEGRERLLVQKLSAAHAEKRRVLLLAPEIEAAEEWAARLEREWDERVPRLHSGRTTSERWKAWTDLLSGAARCAVGTRSAVFAPLDPLGLLAVVDEHDLSYKSPDSPRYHARDVARLRVKEEGGTLCLMSATPSVEAWWQAEDGQIEMEDGGPSPWPSVTVEDLRGDEPRDPLSLRLQEMVRDARARGKQALILVARRGYAPALTCRECGLSIRCRECRLTMTYRRADGMLHCPLCRRAEKARALCPRCRGRQIASSGWGTERVEEAVRAAFPTEVVVRYDGDAARGTSGKVLANAIRSGTARIIVGTRSALKWFRPGTLGLAAVLTPDLWMERPDFRASERAWQLLWEACERVGEGGALIQTRHPEHYVMNSVLHQDKAIFYRHELKFRAELGYPPFSRLARVTVRGKDADQASSVLSKVSQALAANAPEGATLYRPAPTTFDLRSREWQILVKGDRSLAHWVGEALFPLRSRRPSGSRLEIDIDPVELT